MRPSFSFQTRLLFIGNSLMMPDDSIAQRKWADIVSKTEPYLEEAENGTFTLDDARRMTEIIRSQSRLASGMFSKQVSLLKMHAESMRDRVKEKFDALNIPKTAENLSRVLERIFLNLLARRLPEILEKIKNLILSESKKGLDASFKFFLSKYNESVSQSQKQALNYEGTQKLIIAQLQVLAETLHAMPAAVSSQLLKAQAMQQQTRTPLSPDGLRVDVDSINVNEAKMRRMLQDQKRMLTEKLSLPMPEVLAKRLSIEQKQFLGKALPAVAANQAHVALAVNADSAVMHPTISQPMMGVPLPPHIEEIIKNQKDSKKKSDNKTKKKSNERASIEDTVQIADWIGGRYLSGVTEALRSGAHAIDGLKKSVVRKISTLDEENFWSTMFISGLAAYAVSRILGDVSAQKLIGEAVSSVQSVIDEKINSFLKWFENLFSSEGDAPDAGTNPPNVGVNGGTGTDEHGQTVFTMQNPSTGTYMNVRRDDKGNTKVTASNFDPRMIQEGRWQGHRMVGQGNLSELGMEDAGAYYDYYNPKTGKVLRERYLQNMDLPIDVKPQDVTSEYRTQDLEERQAVSDRDVANGRILVNTVRGVRDTAQDVGKAAGQIYDSAKDKVSAGVETLKKSEAYKKASDIVHSAESVAVDAAHAIDAAHAQHVDRIQAFEDEVVSPIKPKSEGSVAISPKKTNTQTTGKSLTVKDTTAVDRPMLSGLALGNQVQTAGKAAEGALGGAGALSSAINLETVPAYGTHSDDSLAILNAKDF